jgi:hypothetical protein
LELSIAFLSQFNNPTALKKAECVRLHVEEQPCEVTDVLSPINTDCACFVAYTIKEYWPRVVAIV